MADGTLDVEAKGFSAALYRGWLKLGRSGTWTAVVEAATEAECYRKLLAHVRALPRLPLATAVLPAGVHPEDRHGAGAEVGAT
jgi:hypothetical protein